MDSLARTTYERRLAIIAKWVKNTATWLYLQNEADAGDAMGELEALFLSELDRSARGRKPMQLTLQWKDGAASSQPSLTRRS